ncbi:MAG TPA: hypothetical protein VF219_08165 [Vicinamibacterales bacterium]
MKLLAVVVVPPGEVTAIGPVEAPAGTAAVIFEADLTVNVAEMPLKVTDVVPVKLLPLMVTDVPTRPLVGEKLLMIGAGVKDPALVAVPAGVVTLIVPVVVPAGATAEIWTLEFTVKLALVPLNFTDVVPVKLAPLIVTVVPTGPLVGEKLVIAGSGLNVDPEVAVPFGFLTLIVPIVASTGTIAVIWVVELIVKLADAPLNVTAVVSRKTLPVITTLVPAEPLDGANPVILGRGLNVALLVAVPAGFVTLIPPVVALTGTVAVI